jgi:hypothetical protein
MSKDIGSAFSNLISLAKGQKHFSAVTAVKEMSRRRFSRMPSEKRISNKKLKAPKYKVDYKKEQ